jgi:hypothetical protein
MVEIYVETVLFFEFTLQLFKQVFITIDSFAATAAYQVMMMSFLGVVVNGLIVQFALIDTARIFKEFESAVDGGFVYSRHSFLDE